MDQDLVVQCFHVLKRTLVITSTANNYFKISFKLQVTMNIQTMLRHGGTVLQSCLLAALSMAHLWMCGQLDVYLQNLLQGSHYGLEDLMLISCT